MNHPIDLQVVVIIGIFAMLLGAIVGARAAKVNVELSPVLGLLGFQALLVLLISCAVGAPAVGAQWFLGSGCFGGAGIVLGNEIFAR